jgi:hypothetical protein
MSPNQEVAPQSNNAPEQAAAEAVVEKKVEQESSTENEGRMVAPVEGKAAASVAAAILPDDDKASDIPAPVKTEEQKKVESILSDGLAELYTELPENRREEFKQKGEEAASQIVILMQSAKVKVGKVVDLIKGWLSMIPGVNKFFLEQESKIKADRLLEYKKDQEEQL